MPDTATGNMQSRFESSRSPFVMETRLLDLWYNGGLSQLLVDEDYEMKMFGLVLAAVLFMASGAQAQCANGQCSLPKQVAKAVATPVVVAANVAAVPVRVAVTTTRKSTQFVRKTVRRSVLFTGRLRCR